MDAVTVPGDDRPPTMAEIGRALGLTRQSVSKLAKEGMPVHSVEAAHIWRKENLDPARRKRGAFDAEMKTRGAVALADALARLAAHSLASDLAHAFPVLVPALRQAMAAVPEHARDRVLITAEVMERLCADSIRYTLKVEAEWAAAGVNQEDSDASDPGPWYHRSSFAYPDGRHRYTTAERQPQPWPWTWYGVATGEVRDDWAYCEDSL